MSDESYWPRIAPYLAAMGYGPADIRAQQVLHEGISGADTYRLTLATGDAILKVTSHSKGRLATERAARELAFYRELAAQLPLPTPRLLAWAADDAGSALLLAAYRAAPSPADWPAADYLTAADQLGRFHAAYWDQADRLAPFPWLRRCQPADDAADVARAHEYWQTLQAQPALASVITAAAADRIHHLVDRLAAVPAMLGALPLTLCHGDCNPWNVLRDDAGGLVWTDWQEVGLGRGPEDLAFLLQQATIAGGHIPTDAALATYHASLTAATGTPIPLPLIQRAVAAAELWSRALYWPAYLPAAPAEQVAAMLERIYQLAGLLGI